MIKRFIRAPYLFVVALIAASCPVAWGADKVIECNYGVPVSYTTATLKYPDFTLRFLKHSELQPTAGEKPWLNEVFVVLDEEGRATGANLIFTSEHKANGRRFDVRNTIFAAELFSTTEGLPDGSGDIGKHNKEIPSGEITVWDEASATAHNLRLAHVWDDKKTSGLTPEQNTYADGEFVSGFTDQSAIEEQPATESQFDPSFPLKAKFLLRTVPTLSHDHISPNLATRPAEYGVETSYRNGALLYPDFLLALVRVDEENPTRPLSHQTLYYFSAFDRLSGDVRSRFIVNNHDGENGFGFDVYNQGYLAEAFRTTKGSPLGDSRPSRDLPLLGDGRFIVWNQKEATLANPRILKVWDPFDPGADVTEGEKRGIALGSFGNGTLTSKVKAQAGHFLPDSPISASALDAPIVPVATAAVAFPAELKGSGYISRSSGYIELNEKGEVLSVELLNQGDSRIRNAIVQSLSHWRFTPPKLHSEAVRPYIPFSIELSEDNAEKPTLIWQ